ncbi:hypothetical protein CF70_027920 [Cupriavidus sp. SK-3]|uniref:hypothetical protein n=1 Tax=Cupriavidus sp. SK-3 TaxID=1470558 RepID=UPI00044DA981|nr:hypothetical protein [Cupriavidus sp. SK-3]KDP88887.1 hypothetical protein CF70_027920 [Cupriavidus sp. SK-3]
MSLILKPLFHSVHFAGALRGNSSARVAPAHGHGPRTLAGAVPQSAQQAYASSEVFLASKAGARTRLKIMP